MSSFPKMQMHLLWRNIGMENTLISKLNHKQNLEAQWASKLLANGTVTVSMVKISKEIKDVEREIIEVTEQKQ